MSTNDNATIQSRVQSALSQVGSYGQQSQDREKYRFTSKGPSAQARFRDNDLTRLNDSTHLEKIVEYTWNDALKATVYGMIGSTVNPLSPGGSEMVEHVHLNMDKIRSLITVAETQDFKDTLKGNLEGQIVQLLASSVSVNYTDHLFSEFQVADCLAATVLGLLTSEGSYDDRREISKDLWKDNCQRRSISDVERLLNHSLNSLFTFDPEGRKTHKIVSSFSIEPSLSPDKFDSFIQERREEANKEKIKAESRVGNLDISDYYGSFLEGVQKRRDSLREEYLTRKRAELETVVSDQSHLTEGNWRENGDLTPMLYPVKMQNGELAVHKLDEDKATEFISLNQPPVVHLWESIEGDKSHSDNTIFPDECTVRERLKAIGIDDQPSESQRSEWDV
ncbi:hypothetical protein I204_04713 [Kwoniella mangroviensis CBS 8886]|nr:hypothetical protein I204_04713 [Kwoniella mangroviensis CBS 8886]